MKFDFNYFILFIFDINRISRNNNTNVFGLIKKQKKKNKLHMNS